MSSPILRTGQESIPSSSGSTTICSSRPEEESTDCADFTDPEARSSRTYEPRSTAEHEKTPTIARSPVRCQRSCGERRGAPAACFRSREAAGFLTLTS